MGAPARAGEPVMDQMRDGRFAARAGDADDGRADFERELGEQRGRHVDGNAGIARNELALRRQDRGDRNQVLLLDVGIAQREFEGR